MESPATMYHTAWKIMREYPDDGTWRSISTWNKVTAFATLAAEEYQVCSKKSETRVFKAENAVSADIDFVNHNNDKMTGMSFANTLNGAVLCFEFGEAKVVCIKIRKTNDYFLATRWDSHETGEDPYASPMEIAKLFYKSRNRCPMGEWKHFETEEYGNICDDNPHVYCVSILRGRNATQVDVMFNVPQHESKLVHTFAFKCNGGIGVQCKIIKIKPKEKTIAPPTAPPLPESLCVVCLDKPATGGAVHGDTMHRCCCEDCVKMLKSKGTKECPMCRASVDCFITKIFQD